jgi:beta-glucosidase
VGSEVVQLYRDAPESALVGFAKVRLQPGEERRVEIAADRRMLRIWDGGWQDLPRPLTLRVARHAEDPGLSVTL